MPFHSADKVIAVEAGKFVPACLNAATLLATTAFALLLPFALSLVFALLLVFAFLLVLGSFATLPTLVVAGLLPLHIVIGAQPFQALDKSGAA